MTTTAVRHRPHISPAGKNGRNPLSERLRSAACYSSIAILVFGPLAFGAVEPWALFILHAGAVTAFLLWLLSIVAAPKPAIELQAIHFPLLVFACVVIGQIMLGGTAYRHETVTQFMNYVAYGLVFLVATDLFRNEREVRVLCLTLAVLGFGLALLGSVQEFTSGGKLYWFRTPRDGGPIFGPYVNRNHYAGAMELLFPFALMSSFKPSLGGGKRVVLGFAALLMVVSVVLCGSRGGFISVILQFVFVLVMLFWRSRKVGLVLILTFAFIATAAFGSWLGSDRLLGRFGEMEKEGGRMQVAKDSLKMVQERPWTGWGLGTFPVVYPKFRSFATDLYVNEAHNDLVQLLVETGTLGFAAGLSLLVMVFLRGLKQLRGVVFASWRKIAICASLVGVLGLSVHSLFDFNLQIPANALLFYVLCAVAGTNSEEDADVIQRMEREPGGTVIESNLV